MGKGKKGAAKEGRVAVKREKEEEDRENEEEKEDTKKQKLLGGEVQEELNEDFLDACYEQPLKEVKSLVERGADLLYFDKASGRNALQFACQLPE
jgi:hypothetical protein